MPENTDPNLENTSTQPSANGNPAAMVTPKNQVTLEPNNPAVVAETPVAPAQPAPAPTGTASAAPQSSEVAWPDTQQAVAGVVESTPNQEASPKTGSKLGLIIGLLVVLGLAIGVYVALRAL